MIVYKVTNTRDGRVYIGKTIKTLEHRREQHESPILRNKFKYDYFHSALKKYGIASFTWEVIDRGVNNEELLEKEKMWIAFYDSTNPSKGFNLTSGGEGLCGYKHLQATKNKISEAHKGRVVSKETREKLRVVNLGKMLSAEHRAKISASNTGRSSAMKGKRHSDETKKKMRESSLGRKHRPESIEKMKKVQANKIVTEKMKERLRQANLGKKLTLETRNRIGQGIKRFYANRKKPT